jgi:hypothetical protein
MGFQRAGGAGQQYKGSAGRALREAPAVSHRRPLLPRVGLRTIILLPCASSHRQVLQGGNRDRYLATPAGTQRLQERKGGLGIITWHCHQGRQPKQQYQSHLLNGPGRTGRTGQDSH